MPFLNRISSALRHFLTASRPTKTLIIVLIGSWLWLGFSLEIPLGPFLSGTLVVVVFVLFKAGTAIDDHLSATRRRNSSRKNEGGDKRDFLLKLALIAAGPVVLTLFVDFWMGIKAAGFVLALTIVYLLLAPGELFPKGWKRKLRRRLQRKLRPT